MSSDSDDIRAACLAHIGKTRTTTDSMAPENAQRLATLLGTPVPKALPPTWHWVYFNPAIPTSELGHDGHERLGLFMPPAPFLRRMWAGGEVTVLEPLRLDAPAERVTTIADVAFKTGKSGDLCFVELRHDISQGGTLSVQERQTIVYRDRGLAETALRQADDPIPDGFRVYPDTLLVAYSAVTQNGHRIHWDRDFCRDVEGYPGLVVHGPLLATLLADTLTGGAPRACRFSYRAKAPVFETSPIRIARDGPRARIERSDGVTAMTAELATEPP